VTGEWPGWPDIRATYDAVAADYAAAFTGELAGKPADRELLDEFAAALGPGAEVWDVGCGAAGHVTRYLADRGLQTVGVDLSAASVAEASRRQPDLRFEVADMRALPAADAALAGVVALYSVIHLPREQIPVALAEFRRVLAPGGSLLVAMHGGSGEIESAEWFGHDVTVRASLVALTELVSMTEQAGFGITRALARPPYPAEHQTERLYVWAQAGPVMSRNDVG
jgi:ubiquinone/menaquinone biosynthesis C-methylase UbiE